MGADPRDGRGGTAGGDQHDLSAGCAGARDAAGALGNLQRLADVPLFADSLSTRLLQAADLVAYALWRYYEYGDDQYIQMLWPSFHSRAGRMHGLIHLTPEYQGGVCSCPPCSRRLSGDVSEMV